jgi:hypothetical protein
MPSKRRSTQWAARWLPLLVPLLLSICHIDALQTAPSRVGSIRPSTIPVPIHLLQHSATHDYQRRVSSVLFSSDGSSLEPSNNQSNSPLQKLKLLLGTMIKSLIAAPSRFKSYYSRLSKKGKLYLGCILLIVASVFGFGVNTAMNRKEVVRPVEVGYSTFLDLVSVNGKVSVALIGVECLVYLFTVLCCFI